MPIQWDLFDLGVSGPLGRADSISEPGAEVPGHHVFGAVPALSPQEAYSPLLLVPAPWEGKPRRHNGHATSGLGEMRREAICWRLG